MRFGTFLVVVALACAPVLAQSASDVIAQGDALFQEVWLCEYTPTTRLDLMAKLNNAIAQYEEALATDRANVHALVMLARCYYTLADIFLTDKREKEKAYAKGQEYGELALRADPNFIAAEEAEGFVAAVRTCQALDAIYWTYANWARKDEFDKLGALLRGDAAKLEALITRAAELDEMYTCAGPLRSLGAFWGGLPALPFGHYRQNLETAYIHLSRAVELCPEYLENLRFLAEYYWRPKGEHERMAVIAREILAAPLGDYPLYNSWTKIWAQGFLSG